MEGQVEHVTVKERGVQQVPGSLQGGSQDGALSIGGLHFRPALPLGHLLRQGQIASVMISQSSGAQKVPGSLQGGSQEGGLSIGGLHLRPALPLGHLHS